MSLASSFLEMDNPRSALLYLSGVIEHMSEELNSKRYAELSAAIELRAKELSFNIKFIDLDAEEELVKQAEAACSE